MNCCELLKNKTRKGHSIKYAQQKEWERNKGKN